MNVPLSAISGIGCTPITRDLERPLMDTCAAVVREALDDAGISAGDVDGLFTTPAAISAEPWMMFAAHMGEYLGFHTKALASYENGGITALVALRSALDAVALGRCNAAVVLTMDTRPTLDMMHFESFMRGATHKTIGLHGPFNGLMGLGAPIPIYAMSHQRYMHEFGLTEAQVAQSSVLLRQHAAKNPYAQFKDPVTVDDVLASPVLSPPVHLMQSAGISSGVCAVVVTRADAISDSSRPKVTVKGYGEYHHPSHFIPRNGNITTFESVKRSAAQAYETAGIKATDIDVAEVYGVFGATELILYEDLGFCPKGEAAHFMADGRTTHGGDVLINASGGRLSMGHPAGATPLYEVVEIVRHLRNEAGDRQRPNAKLGLIQAEHGMMNGSIVMVFEGGN